MGRREVQDNKASSATARYEQPYNSSGNVDIFGSSLFALSHLHVLAIVVAVRTHSDAPLRNSTQRQCTHTWPQRPRIPNPRTPTPTGTLLGVFLNYFKLLLRWDERARSMQRMGLTTRMLTLRDPRAYLREVSKVIIVRFSQSWNNVIYILYPALLQRTFAVYLPSTLGSRPYDSTLFSDWRSTFFFECTLSTWASNYLRFSRRSVLLGMVSSLCYVLPTHSQFLVMFVLPWIVALNHLLDFCMSPPLTFITKFTPSAFRRRVHYLLATCKGRHASTLFLQALSSVRVSYTWAKIPPLFARIRTSGCIYRWNFIF